MLSLGIRGLADTDMARYYRGSKGVTAHSHSQAKLSAINHVVAAYRARGIKSQEWTAVCSVSYVTNSSCARYWAMALESQSGSLSGVRMAGSCDVA